MLILLNLLLIIVILVYLHFKLKYRTFSSRNVPEIPPIFPFGSSRSVLNGSIGIGPFISSCYRHFKLLGHSLGGVYILNRPVFLVCDPGTAKDVLQKDFAHFTDTSLYANERDDPLSGHLVALKGLRWKRTRTKMTPAFTSGKIRTMYPLLVECSKNFAEYMRRFAEEKEAVVMKEYFARFTTDVIGSCAFGLDCNSFDDNPQFRAMGRKIFQGSFSKTCKRTLAMAFPDLARKLHVKLTSEDVSDFFMGSLRETLGRRMDEGKTRGDFLQMMSELMEKGEMSFEEVCAQCFVFFVAGFETSSTLGNFCLYELGRDLEVQERLRREVEEGLDKGLTYEVLQEMKYLEAVLDETLRKYPPLFFVARKCTKDWTDPKTGSQIKTGESIFVPVHGFQKDEDFFPNPDRFDPERFNETNRKNITPFTYMPFGEGPRICLGMRFGMLQAKLGVAMMVSRFKITVSEKTKEPLEPAMNTFVHATKDPIYLNLEEISRI